MNDYIFFLFLFQSATYLAISYDLMGVWSCDDDQGTKTDTTIHSPGCAFYPGSDHGGPISATRELDKARLLERGCVGELRQGGRGIGAIHASRARSNTILILVSGQRVKRTVGILPGTSSVLCNSYSTPARRQGFFVPHLFFSRGRAYRC
ncbi:hypothetical protein VTH06DRAFT_3350 [Thermothelomyces fergusii]